MIYIECSDSHDRVNIAAAEGDAASGWRLIAAAPGRLEEASIDDAARVLSTGIDGHRRNEVRGHDRREALARAHTRVAFTCTRCRRRVLTTDAHLLPILGVLQHAGVDHITLTALGARLRNSGPA